jgi:hypothetical protein
MVSPEFRLRMLIAQARKITLAALLMALSDIAAMAAPAPMLNVAQLLDFCRSTTMAEAERKGDAFGWRRGGDDKSWREGFLDANGGTVGVLVWRRSDSEADGMLSFWIAVGESRHRACSYATGEPEGLLDGLKQAFGTPSAVFSHDFGEVVTWTQGHMEASLSRVNSSVDVVISHEF